VLKILIVITTIIFPLLAVSIIANERSDDSSAVFFLLYFIVFAAINPFIVIFSAYISETIYKWAYPNSDRWGKEAKMFVGAFWPLTLPLYLIIFFALGVINRFIR
jgi:hypothetical protein